MPLGRTMTRARRTIVLLAAGAVLVVAAPAHAAEPAEPAPAGPALRSLTLDRTVVDTSSGPAFVGVSVVVDLPEGAAAVTLRLGELAPATPLYRATGGPADGTWVGVLTVPAFTPYGARAAYADVTSLSGLVVTVGAGAPLTVADAPPAAPAGVAFHPVDGAPGVLRAQWAEPPANGGSAVTAYDVAAVPAPGSDPSALTPASVVLGAAARAADFAVTPGTRYVLRVAARNAAGSGAAAVADATTAAGTVPDAPAGVVARAGDGTVRVEWAAPRSDGGSPVERYDVRVTPRDPAVPAPAAVSVAEPGAVVAELANGVPHDVTVTAVNAAGESLPATTAGTPLGPPGAPVLGAVTPGDGTVELTWSPPASDGGAPVHAYTVSGPSGSPVTLPATARSVTMRGLANGTAVTFTVTASNVAGTGPAAVTASVVPRRPARLAARTLPVSPVVYGRVTAVAARMTGLDGAAIEGQRVDLMARTRPSTVWRRVAYGRTDASGNVTLRATLRATSSLRLHHPAGAVEAPDRALPGVVVAPRVTAYPSATRVSVGQALGVRGNVAPAHAAGTGVRLQRYVSGAWRTVASGRMTTTTAYRVTWRPATATTYLLRVVLPAHADHTTGVSPRWHQSVTTETAADVARAILADGGIVLARVHSSGVGDLATARQNVVDVAAGRLARRSSYGTAPGGYTALDRRLLRAIRHMGRYGTVTVSEIAGGTHARNSAHYSGRALDVTYVNGRHVGRGSGYALAVDACRAFGASRIFHPSYDPYGGHSGHVHCEWS